MSILFYFRLLALPDPRISGSQEAEARQQFAGLEPEHGDGSLLKDKKA